MIYNIKIILILTLLMTSILSCRFSKPVIPVRISKSSEVNSSSVDESKKVRKEYLCISLIRLKAGTCMITEVYDNQGNRTKKKIARSDNGLLHGRGAVKTKTFDASGNLIRVDRVLGFYGGYSNVIIVDKSVFYENGKKIKKVNRVKNKKRS